MQTLVNTFNRSKENRISQISLKKEDTLENVEIIDLTLKNRENKKNIHSFN